MTTSNSQSNCKLYRKIQFKMMKLFELTVRIDTRRDDQPTD
jgi:hypothetical protein